MSLSSNNPQFQKNNHLISIVIPVFNEKKYVLDVISKVLSIPLHKEIIVIDDCSTDGTRQLLQGINNKIVKIFFHDRNQGKGAALRTGFKNVAGDIVIIQDSDLEYNPEEYNKLIQPIVDKKADVVYGSRFAGGEAHRVVYFWHMLGNKFLTLLSNIFSNLTLTDMETCYKAFTIEVLNKLTIEESRFGFEPEFTAKIAKMDVRIYEVGISYYGRSYREGKKINWKDGFSALRCILKYNLLR